GGEASISILAMVRKGCTRRELLDRWSAIQEELDGDDPSPSRERRILRAKEEWFYSIITYEERVTEHLKDINMRIRCKEYDPESHGTEVGIYALLFLKGGRARAVGFRLAGCMGKLRYLFWPNF
ncbi:hypothetical protein BHE74_00025135, partial [Ensete ventricosum]